MGPGRGSTRDKPSVRGLVITWSLRKQHMQPKETSAHRGRLHRETDRDRERDRQTDRQIERQKINRWIDR